MNEVDRGKSIILSLYVNTITTMKRIMFLLLAAVLLVACGNTETKEKRTLARSKGLPSELLLLVDKDVWLTDVQDTLRAIVEGQVPGLMQAENMFRVTRVFTRDYAPTHSTFHTILKVVVDETLEKPFTGTARDVNARPQIEVVVAAPNIDQLRTYLSLNAGRIQDILAEAHIEMRVSALKKKHSKKVQDDLREVLGMTVCVPENLVATKKGTDFLWGGTNTLQKDQNILVYTYPWHGEDVMDADLFVHKRDSVIKVNIPGERHDQWMQTVRENDAPLIVPRQRYIDGRKVLEVRGLWEMRNGALGGPFVSLARVDTAASKVIVAEGWVYSPSTDKRDLLRQMEAALRTLQ